MAEDGSMRIALAGIIATAVVGVSGTTAALIATHETNSTQQRIAREQLSYQGRASAYTQAMQAADEWIISQSGAPFDAWVQKWSQIHPALRAQITAYGSTAGRHAYDRMMFALLHRTRDDGPAINNFETIANHELAH